MTIPATPLITCPDCPAVADPDTKVVQHFDGCPVGRALDEMRDADRQWFVTHPYADRYHRPLMPGDFGIASLHNIMAAGKVEVHKLNDEATLRYRRLPQVAVVIDQDGELSPDAMKVVTLISGWSPIDPEQGRRP